MKRKLEVKVLYKEISRTPQETEDAERRLERAYDILFEETQRRRSTQESS